MQRTEKHQSKNRGLLGLRAGCLLALLQMATAVSAYEGDGYRDFLIDRGYLKEAEIVRKDDQVHYCYPVVSNQMKPEDQQAWRDLAVQSVSAVVSGGEGLTYIAWSEGGDFRSRVYLKAIDTAGRTLWGPIAADASIAPQEDLQLIPRGADGVVLSWVETPYDCTEQQQPQIRFKAQKFDRSGKRLWGEHGVTLHESPWRYRYQLLPSGATAVTGVWFGWDDEGANIYLQRIDDAGKRHWPEQAKKVQIKGQSDFDQLRVVPTSDGGLMLSRASHLMTKEEGSPLAIPISRTGEFRWTLKGGHYGAELDPYRMQADAAGTTFFGNLTARHYKDRHLAVLRLDSEGMVAWQTVLDDKVGIPEYDYDKGEIRRFVSDGAGGVIAIWIKNGNEDSLFLAQHVDKDGKVLWEKPVVLGNARIGARLDAAPDGSGGAFVTWITYDMARGRQWPEKSAIIFQDIRIQRVDSTGALTWDKPAFVAGNIGKTGMGDTPTIASDGEHGAIVAWIDGRAGFEIAPMSEEDKFEESDIPDPQITSAIYAQRICASGEMMWQDDGIDVGAPKASPMTCLERTSDLPIVGALAVNLRTAPSLTSEVLKPLYRSTELRVLERSDNCETINGRPGRWVRVREHASNDSQGWVFDAYLAYPQHADPYPIWPMVP